jgi:hypothetical protein
MSISSCGKHDIVASKRCAVCHRPLCVHCKVIDQCCSKKCFESRQKFGFQSMKPVERRGGGFPWGAMIKLALFAGACYGAARYFGYL